MARFKLSKEARMYRRMRLFSGTRLPTDPEKWHVYDEIVEIFGCSGYTRHQHSNWCTGRERGWLKSPRTAIAAKLHGSPNPMAVDIARWALELQISEADAFRLVGELLPEPVKARAAFEHFVNHSQVTMAHNERHDGGRRPIQTSSWSRAPTTP